MRTGIGIGIKNRIGAGVDRIDIDIKTAIGIRIAIDIGRYKRRIQTRNVNDSSVLTCDVETDIFWGTGGPYNRGVFCASESGNVKKGPGGTPESPSPLRHPAGRGRSGGESEKIQARGLNPRPSGAARLPSSGQCRAAAHMSTLLMTRLPNLYLCEVRRRIGDCDTWIV
ncbi:hypothetical protein EVAR_67243_1 [Eumeta japonica]|uniref:Uncharacterized protein n=1 Tax=Eumeta variegata TaxID=151549 RepID=A0A4C1YUZ3_EUMVA|nr:hypothetical protein EVAR_67243_1 [Eumeta japonica]